MAQDHLCESKIEKKEGKRGKYKSTQSLHRNNETREEEEQTMDANCEAVQQYRS